MITCLSTKRRFIELAALLAGISTTSKALARRRPRITVSKYHCVWLRPGCTCSL